MDKLGSLFFLAKCLKNTCESDILSKDTGHRPASLRKRHSSTGAF